MVVESTRICKTKCEAACKCFRHLCNSGNITGVSCCFEFHLHYAGVTKGQTGLGDLCLLTPTNTVPPPHHPHCCCSLPEVNTTQTVDYKLISPKCRHGQIHYDQIYCVNRHFVCSVDKIELYNPSYNNWYFATLQMTNTHPHSAHAHSCAHAALEN